MNRHTAIRRPLSFALVFAFMLGMFTVAPLTARAANHIWNGTAPTVANGDTVTITGTASGTLTVPANATVTIDGDVPNNAPQITLNIGSGAKVQWAAEYIGSTAAGVRLITIAGNGELEVVAGASIQNEGLGTTIYSNGASAKVTVSGGEVISNGTTSANPAIYMSNSTNTGLNVTVSGGAVKAAASSGIGIAIYSSGSVNVTDGEVTTTTGRAINALGANSVVTVGGGTVKATDAGGYAVYAAGNVSVTGGAVSATTASAIYATNTYSTVAVSGGEVSNSGAASGSAAINSLSNTSLGVIISGTGKVAAKAAGGFAIQTSGDVSITGGEVSATTGRAVSAIGRTVTVSGGTVSATTGVAIFSGTVTVNGGFVFAYGNGITGTTNVINATASYALNSPAGDGVVAAWNNTASPGPFDQGSAAGLTADPAGAAKWDSSGAQSGVSYQNGANTGFLPLPVTVNGSTPQPTRVTYAAAQIGGASATANSTAIRITFSQAVTGLSASDITISNGTGIVTTGTLSGSGTVWLIALTAVGAEGDVTVDIADFGTFDVTTGPQTVAVYKYAPGNVSSFSDFKAAYKGVSNGETITLTGNIADWDGTLDIQKSITVDGAGFTITYSGTSEARHLYIFPSNTVTLKNITLDGNSVGGGIQNSGAMAMDSVVIKKCKSAFGGGIYNSKPLTLTDVTIQGCSATNYGGGIYNVSGAALTVGTGSVISGNEAPDGGGVYNSGSGSTVNVYGVIGGSVGSGNKAINGGGVYNVNGASLTVGVGGVISGNEATEYGGGVCNNGSGSTVSVYGVIGGSVGSGNKALNGGGVYILNKAAIVVESGGEVSGNEATEEGGGVYNVDSSVTVKAGGAITENAAANGGGVYSRANNATIDISGAVTSNDASGHGGGIYNHGGGVVTILSSGKVSGNNADCGGGIYNRSSLDVSSSGSSVNVYGTIGGANEGNFAGCDGGGIYSAGDNAIVTIWPSGAVSGNMAVTGSGGGIFNKCPDGTLTVYGAIGGVNLGEGNAAIGNGGGVYNEDGDVLVESGGVISGNLAVLNGGGISTNYLDLVTMASGSAFSGNTAYAAAYWMSAASPDVTTHDNQIGSGVTFSNPPDGHKRFLYAYNNYDIAYTNGLTANPLAISGRVTGDTAPGGLAATLQLKNSGGANVGGAITANADGTYAMSAVPPGTYTISVSMAGYTGGEITGVVVGYDDVPNKNIVLTASVAPGVVSVAVSPQAISVQQGSTQQFIATVVTTGGAAQTVNWTVTGGASANTSIGANGLLAVGADESAATLTVTATSTADGSKSDSATVTVVPLPPPDTAPNIMAHPSNQSIPEGQSATFTVSASGNPAPTYQWQVDTGSGWVDIPGATNATLTLNNVTPTMSGNLYRCVATNSAGSAISNTATLTVTPAPSYTYTVTFNGNGGSPATQTRTVTAPATTVGTLPAAPTRANYSFIGWNTVSDGSGAAFTSATTVSGNITVYAQWTYTGGYSGDSGGSSYTPPNPLRIVNNIITITQLDGTRARLGVQATGGNPPYTYQWQYIGSWIDIPNATSAEFTWEGLTPGQTYTVRCVVKDRSGTTVISPELTFTAGEGLSAFPVKGEITSKNVSVLPDPSTKGKRLSRLQTGDEVSVLGYAVPKGYSYGFFKIAWDNAAGYAYISADYVSVTFTSPLNAGILGRVYIQSSMSTAKKYRLATLTNGDAAQLLGRYKTWWVVECNGEKAYMKNGKYIRP